MSEPAQPPEQWRPLFDKIGVEFGYRPLATRIDMDHTRLRRLLLGGGTTSAAIQAVADGFGVSPEKIRELRGERAVAYEPFTLPDDAGRLNHSERRVIRAMVRALLDARDGSHDVEADSPAGTSRKARQDQEAKPSLDELEKRPGGSMLDIVGTDDPRVDASEDDKHGHGFIGG